MRGDVVEGIRARIVDKDNQPAWKIKRSEDVARDVEGKFGGLFWSRQAAIRFAKNVRPGGCATVFPQGRFELDIENDGNPLIIHLANTGRLLAHGVHRLIAAFRKLARPGDL